MISLEMNLLTKSANHPHVAYILAWKNLKILIIVMCYTLIDWNELLSHEPFTFFIMYSVIQ